MAVALFTLIDDGVAIVRKPKGVQVQAKLYHRKGQVFIGAAGGFLRITDCFDSYGTTHPDYKVLELEGTGIRLEGKKAPVYAKGWGPVE